MTWATDSVEGPGWFWDAMTGSEDDAVPGTLDASQSAGISLTLLIDRDHELANADLSDNESEEALHLHGWVGDEAVTVLGAHLNGYSNSGGSPLASKETYRADSVVVGAHVEVRDSSDGITVDIDAIAGSIDLLSDWAPMGRIAADIRRERHRSIGITISYDVPDVLSVDAADGSIELQPEWTQPGSITSEAIVRSRTLARRSWAEPVTLRTAMSALAGLQKLLALISGDAVDITDSRLHHPDRRFMQDDRTVYRRAELISNWIWRRPADRDLLRPALGSACPTLVTFEEFGGMDAIAVWMDLYPTVRAPISMAIAPIYAERMPIENRLANRCGAAEGLHREWHPIDEQAEQQAETRRRALTAMHADRADRELVKRALRYAHEPSLAGRLADLARMAPETSASLVVQPKRWAEAVQFARNRVAHPPTTGEREKESELGIGGATGGDMHYLQMSTYWVTVFALLRRVGIADETLRAAVDRSELWSLKCGVETTMSYWRHDHQRRGFALDRSAPSEPLQ